MSRINEVDRQVLEALPGADKIKALLQSKRGLSVKEFAGKHSEWPERVSDCIRGVRPHPQIRDALAAELDLSRKAVDELIDGKAA